jgi:hypothetical protein
VRGAEQLQQDVPGAARRIAALKEAPHVHELLKRLGQLEPATMMEVARFGRLSGRSPVTLGDLYRRCWQLWRATGVLSAPIPPGVPFSPEVIASVIRTSPGVVEVPPPAPGAPGQVDEADLKLLLSYRPDAPPEDHEALVEQVGFVAGVFDRAHLKVATRKGPALARRLVEGVRERFDLASPSRISGSAKRSTAAVSVAILVR